MSIFQMRPFCYAYPTALIFIYVKCKFRDTKKILLCEKEKIKYE